MTAAISHRPLLALFLAVAFGNAWSLQYASTLLIGSIGLAPLGSLFTVHLLLAVALVALLSVRCELFVPTSGELGFFLLAGLLGAVSFSAPAWRSGIIVAPLAFGFCAFLLARFSPRRLNALQVITGVAAAAAALLMPLAKTEGEAFLFDGRLGTSDLALVGFALTIGAEYYLLTLLARFAGVNLLFRNLDT